MICSGCRKRIPLSRERCPNCGRDTNSDQQAHLLSLISFGFLLAIGFFAGHLAFGAAAGVISACLVQIIHWRLQRSGRKAGTLRSPEPD